MRKHYYFFLVVIPMALLAVPKEDHKKKKTTLEATALLQSLPDSVFQVSTPKNLLDEKTYIQLAKEGWSNTEIIRLTDDFLAKHKKEMRGTYNYGLYAKQWKPYFGNTLSNDSMYQYIDTTYNETMQRRVQRAFALADESYERIFYTPQDRLNKKRNIGYFRHAAILPAGGRIHWIQANPTNPDQLMIIPDGDGIWKTDNMGKNWKCITDRIPNRFHRSVSNAYAIPVDPDDWNHVFAFMNNGNPVYETVDGGESWTQVPGATHKGFKRGYCFRDAKGALKFIGAKPNVDWNSSFYISEDTCKTWIDVLVPDELKDIHPTTQNKGFWFQEFSFHPTNRDLIYVPTSRSILRFTDGAKVHTNENGKKTFHVEKMRFKVYAADGVTLRSDTTVFPLEAVSPMFLNIDPANGDRMWAALASRGPLATALYFSSDGGNSWITYHEPGIGVGTGTLFGREAPLGWLGGFGLNYKDPNFFYGCTMNSAFSTDGGHVFEAFAWGNRMKGFYPDGSLYTVSCSRHNADNHCITSHASGRVFRGSDGGMLMKDKAINDHNWTNISGDMGQMLFYTSRVNEFGDQLIMGNTQDVDQQTYRYGRWGNYRGYEGSTAFVNPMSSECYFSGGNGGSIKNQSLDSWDKGWSKADVCTGNWYLKRETNKSGGKFFVIKDFGNTSIQLDPLGGSYVRDFALCRDTEFATLYALTENGKLYCSYNQGENFSAITTPINNVNHIATNPNNSKEIYLSSNTKGVYKTTDGGAKWELITANLPAEIPVTSLYYHEGSGDLYLVSANYGVYLNENGSNTWQLWMKGYNPAAFNDAMINYTTQEMVLDDYGRGVWVADLQHPSDRYFKDGFSLKQLSHINGARTLGIDTHWTIPLYYYYEWTVNGIRVDVPYQYLTSSTLKVGDKVQLKLTLRESPDVSTLSAEYVVADEASVTKLFTKGNSLSSDGVARVDLGNVDFFFKDFTIEFWMNARSNGVFLANRTKDNKDAKGWFLEVANNQLQFKYTPAWQFSQPLNETAISQHATLNAGAIILNKWNHVAISEERNGDIHIYINGVKCVSQKRILPEHTLNNSLNLSLFADGYERNSIDASIDELKIWNKALGEQDIRKQLFSCTPVEGATLVYHNDFNAKVLNEQFETFSGKEMKLRTAAVVSFSPMPVAIGAEWAGIVQMNDQFTVLTDQNHTLAAVRSKVATYTPQVAMSGYNQDVEIDEGNLDEKYHILCPTSFSFKLFDVPASSVNDTIDLKLFVDHAETYQDGRLYISDIDGLKQFWIHHADLKYDATDQSLKVYGIRASQLDNKRLVIVKMKPAIELGMDKLNTKGQLEVYEETNKTYAITARLIEQLEEPFTAYSYSSDKEYIKPIEPFYFTKGEATAKLFIHTDSLGSFNQTNGVIIKGEDEQMIPYPLDVVNKITPHASGNSVLFTGGGASIGNAEDYASMHLSNTISLMGWIRIDSSEMLSNTKPLIFFYGAGPYTGLHLLNGELRCHWNGESWSWSLPTSFKIKPSDLGKWMHVALVTTPTSVTYYLNGQKFVSTRTINKTGILDPLMLGKMRANENFFKGAFDQVSVWNRSLTEQEVLTYMHQRVLVDAPGLVAYVNMDALDEKNQLLEAKNNLKVNLTGSYTFNYRSPIPYQAIAQEKRKVDQTGDANSTIDLILPTGFKGDYYITTFNQFPYNYASQDKSIEMPLLRSYWTVAYTNSQTVTDADTIRVTFRHLALVAGDSLSLGLRPIGSEEPFAQRVPAFVTESGTVTFSVPAGWLSTASQLMLFVTPQSAHPAIVKLNGGTTQHIILKDVEAGIPIEIELLSGSVSDTILLSVKEPYASFDRDTVTFETSSLVRHFLKIDRSQLNKLELNPLTIQCQGAQAEALSLMLSLEPMVELKLKNGDTGTHITTNRGTVDLEIEAELTQGVFTDRVEFATTADVNRVFSTGGGDLLTNKEVQVKGLSYYPSSSGATQAGWNLIGNPYLANINLTKLENVTAQNVTRFLYQYNPETLNYNTVDMTYYDGTQKIAPFQSYFVQTMSAEALMQIHPFAKEPELNRKNTSYFVVSENEDIKLSLYADGKQVDATVVRFESGASPEFIVNEDAPKFWSISNQANQLYTLAETSAASVNTLSSDEDTISVELLVGKNAAFSFKAESVSGFKKGDKITLFDQLTNQQWQLEAGTSYDFAVAATGKQANRFLLKVERQGTLIETTTTWRISVKDQTCYIDHLSGTAHIRIFDVQGKMVSSDETSASHWQATLQPGVYLVRVKEGGKESTSKISVR